MDTSQNLVQRLINELANLIDSQTELRKAVDNLDTRLQALERTQANLGVQIGEVPAAVTRITRADVAETLSGLRKDSGHLREALRSAHDLAGRITPGVKALEARSDRRWDVLGFVVVVLLMGAPLVAQAYLNMSNHGMIDPYSVFLGVLVTLIPAGFLWYGARLWFSTDSARISSHPRADA